MAGKPNKRLHLIPALCPIAGEVPSQVSRDTLGGQEVEFWLQVVVTANLIRKERYPNAAAVFVAGSYLRGEATIYSDLDLVVIFDQLPSAYRESFRFGTFPIEAFVHDPETLRYFILEVDRASGIPALPQMIVEGIEIPASNSIPAL
jgi:hypothetical protein